MAFLDTFYMVIPRSIEGPIAEFIKEKPILLLGPRDVGKSEMFKQMGPPIQYLNFENQSDRQLILTGKWALGDSALVFDEITKFSSWINWAKEIAETKSGSIFPILSGSSGVRIKVESQRAFLESVFRVRLNPLSVREVKGYLKLSDGDIVKRMMELGSFPEPFLSGHASKARLWRRSHIEKVFYKDILHREKVASINNLEILYENLAQNVGQAIVYSDLARMLFVSSHTIKLWIDILERYYLVFRVHPLVNKIVDPIRREEKIYLYDLGQVVENYDARLENLLALHLLKRNQFIEDTTGAATELHYIRDKKGRSVDFAIATDGTITHLIQVARPKSEQKDQLSYFAKRLNSQQTVELYFEDGEDNDLELFKRRELATYLGRLMT